MDYVASLRSLIVESKNLGCNAQILAYFVISIVLRKTRLASVGYVCLYLAYVWQIRRSGRRYLACIWQTHAAKTSKRTPELPVFAGDVPYISEMSPYEKQNLPYITQIDRLKWGYCAK